MATGEAASDRVAWSDSRKLIGSFFETIVYWSLFITGNKHGSRINTGTLQRPKQVAGLLARSQDEGASPSVGRKDGSLKGQ